jgi:uncharacterized membrane protein YczE
MGGVGDQAGEARKRALREILRADGADALSFGWRLVLLMVGIFVFSYGLTMTLGSGLGLGPWDVLHQGLTFHTSLTFGQAGIVVGAVVVLASLLLRIKPGIGTIANMVGTGLFVDAIIASPLMLDARERSLPEQVLLDLGGIAVLGLGSALYIKAALGGGPRDSLMLGLSRATGLRVGLVRALIETSALAVGFLLGGTAGVGTVLFALGIGPAVDVSFRLIGVPDPSDRRPAPGPGR